MTKYLLILLMLEGSSIYADWFDDIAMLFGETEHFNDSKALAVIKDQVKKDETEVASFEQKLKDNEPDSLWATIKGSTWQVQWAAAQANLNYHLKVQKFIKELPCNQKERKKFIESLQAVRKNLKELEEFNKEYSEAQDITEKMRAGALIAAKNIELKGRKAWVMSKIALS